MEKLIKSKERVNKFAEVYTPGHIVNDMCDIGGNTLNELSSKVLEPACGNGNFLVEILSRKLSAIKDDFYHNSLIAVSSVYGVDIQGDNVKECRERLYNLVLSFGDTDKITLKKILERNIICGNTLTQTTSQGTDLIFTDYVFKDRIVCLEHSFKDMLNGISDKIIKVYLL